MKLSLKRAIFCVGLIFSEKLIPKILISPLPDYYSIAKKTSCMENPEIESDCGFISDLNISYSRRLAANAYNDKNKISDLAVLFHGYESFNSADIMGPLTIDATGDALKSNFSVNPSYSWENQNCKIEANVYKNFEICGKDFEFSAKINVPFSMNKIINTDVSRLVKRTPYDPVNKSLKNNNLKNKNTNVDDLKTSKLRRDFPIIENQEQSFTEHRYMTRKEDGVDVFAIRGDYAFENFIDVESDPINFKYVFFNKNLPVYPYTGINNLNITLDNIFKGMVLVSDSQSLSSPMHLESVTTVNGDILATTSGGYYPFKEDPFNPTKNVAGAIVPIYSYYQQGLNPAYVSDTNFDFDLSLKPNFVDDINYGSSISLDNIYYSKVEDETLSANPIPQASFLKVVATGKYNNGDYNLSKVTFEVPPIIIQKTEGEFPSVFGLNVEMPDHNYSTAIDKQFDDYVSSLTTVAVLNEDGTFSNNAQNGVLWYGYNYSDLKENASTNENLKNIYFTTSLDSEGNASNESLAFHDVLESGRTPDLTMEERVANLEYTVYEDPDLSNKNLFDAISNLQSGTLLTADLNDFVEQFGINSALNGAIPVSESRASDFSSTNKQEKMQYNSFYQEGLGDISGEFKLGKHFKEDQFYADLFAGVSLPTSSTINDSDSYFAVPLGNNGHTVLRLGLEGIWNNEKLIRSSFFAKAAFDFALKNRERLIPGLINENPGKLVNGGNTYTYPVIGAVPLKIDVNNHWCAFTGNLGGMFMLNDNAGFNLNYQIWYKWKDKISVLGNNKIEKISYAATKIANPADSKGNTFINLPTERIVTFDKTSELSRRVSNTVAFSVFLNLNEDIHFDIGLSKVFHGRNVPQSSDYFATVQIDF